MSKKNLTRLTDSIRQAGRIRRGEIEPRRQWTIEVDEFDKTADSLYKSWAIYVADEDDDLVPRKIYEIEVFPALSNVRVIDEAGEVVLCPNEWFVPIAVQQILAERLAATV